LSGGGTRTLCASSSTSTCTVTASGTLFRAGSE
jgi:hypothetical protein